MHWLILYIFFFQKNQQNNLFIKKLDVICKDETSSIKIRKKKKQILKNQSD